MCGICGVVQIDSTPSIELVQRMTATLVHRGPDGAGYLFDGPVGFGMRRLAVIDLATGDQPIFNEDRSIAVIFNGEIFNYRALRDQLQRLGHRFVTLSDTETIVHAYEQWGESCPAYFNGQFAFAVWDGVRRQVLLARDHLGIKPLYYTQSGGTLIFGSELKALQAHPLCPHAIDPIGLDQYLALRYVPAPRTILQGVYKLPPAHILRWKDGQITLQRYWDIHFMPVPERSQGEWVTELRGLLEDAVEKQMVADVPLGAFLSGGIDSSIIVGLMAHYASAPVRTFSVAFPNWPGLDESPYARRVAQYYGTNHEEITVITNIADELPALVKAFDEPFADPAAYPTMLMARAARQHVTVVLTGEGADELFAGYGWYGWAERRWRLPLPIPIRKRLHLLAQTWLQGRRGAGTITARLSPDFLTMMFDSCLSSAAPSVVRKMLYVLDWYHQLGNRNLPEDFPWVTQLASSAPEQSRMQELDVKIWLEGDPLVKVDRTTMAASLEARVPFLDYRIVELAARIPPSIQRAGGQSKALLRQAFSDLLPEEILRRPKHAFEVPISDWLRGELREIAAENLIGGGLRHLPMLNPTVVANKWSEHQSGRRDHGRLLWALLMLALWANHNR
jgi:asparagine synthase (glutamine-hydrolysing)